LGTAYYGLNVSNGTLGPKVMLRQALAMAIDRKTIGGNAGVRGNWSVWAGAPHVNYDPNPFMGGRE